MQKISFLVANRSFLCALFSYKLMRMSNMWRCPPLVLISLRKRFSDLLNSYFRHHFRQFVELRTLKCLIWTSKVRWSSCIATCSPYVEIYSGGLHPWASHLRCFLLILPTIFYMVCLLTCSLSDNKSPSGRGQHNPANRGKRPAVRKERDDKIHDTLIEERIQRERPCRTLFIRNIKVWHPFITLINLPFEGWIRALFEPASQITCFRVPMVIWPGSGSAPFISILVPPFSLE